MRYVVSGQIPPAKLKKVSQSSRKTFRSYIISKNELESSPVATISLWGILLLVRGDLELANTPISPCYHHIDAAFDCSMCYQLSNPFCHCPGQQATTCRASSARIYKTTADHRKYHSPLDGLTTIRTLRLKTSKWGRPKDPYCPSTTRISQRDLNALIPKELGPPSLEGEMLGS